MKRIAEILLVFAMAFILLGSEAIAGETVEDKMKESNEFFEKGVLSVPLPADGDNWTEIQDPVFWFAISDGRDLITVERTDEEEPLSDEAIKDDIYEEVYQEYYTTEEGVFVVTGYVDDSEDAEAVSDSVSSVQILAYEDEEYAPGFDLRELDETGYCIQLDGVYMRSGPSTDNAVIREISYTEAVNVIGIVTEDGIDTGWLCVDQDGQEGYVWGDYFSTIDPEAEFDLAEPDDWMSVDEWIDSEETDEWQEAGDWIQDEELNLQEELDENGGKVLFRLYNDGWYVARLSIQIRNESGVQDYYTKSCSIGKAVSYVLEVPENTHEVFVSLEYWNMGWIYESKYCDYYDNLNDPKLDAVSCWSGGTVFKPTFYSYEVMSD